MEDHDQPKKMVLDVIVTSIRTLLNQSRTVVISLWKSKTGLVELDQVLMQIISITLESSALPALYTIGMLRTLNSRAKLRQRMKSHDLGRTSLGEWQWDQATNPSSFSSNLLSEVPRATMIGDEKILTAAIIQPPRAFDTSSTLGDILDKQQGCTWSYA
ncbi:hypothetical protein D9615_000481 [Tricholomella constricta]|uniref:Uncharacterized protein n=1 Tax=Tricholomella constricta TaxID=117010 RepID=A0A8H5MB92_9AGAR|nr:hypothetical protein D9615_000481 [Tricholomella constricta]